MDDEDANRTRKRHDPNGAAMLIGARHLFMTTREELERGAFRKVP